MRFGFSVGRRLPSQRAQVGMSGSMHTWPETSMISYAIREVGYVLNNYVRTYPLEIPASDYLAEYAQAE